MIKAVMFDLDGTLLDTLDDLTSAVNAAMLSIGKPRRTKNEVRGFIGDGVHTLLQRASGVFEPFDDLQAQSHAAAVDAFNRYYKENMKKNTAPYDGVLDLLVRLSKENCRLAVISNKSHDAVISLVDDFFPGLVEVAAGIKSISDRKPDPSMLIAAMKQMRLNSHQCIYVGDSEIDYMAASAAHVAFAAVGWGFRDAAALIKYGCEKPAANCGELYDRLCEISNGGLK